ncbi:hypothetical protein Nepgr_018850 [Nepenthes gracilis]|uniref:Uncharacterized protein n=1 Tax=Nepenthes gracilis TaxID=150966 RepID=A0AAD3XUF1_NEPGR|nr:hypothetical protein Nepgr_018850 [Nepenthes gracilis]
MVDSSRALESLPFTQHIFSSALVSAVPPTLPLFLSKPLPPLADNRFSVSNAVGDKSSVTDFLASSTGAASPFPQRASDGSCIFGKELPSSDSVPKAVAATEVVHRVLLDATGSEP